MCSVVSSKEEDEVGQSTGLIEKVLVREAYHVLFKRNKRWLVWLASGLTVGGDVHLWLNDAGTEELDTTNHYAHFEGFVVGLAAAYLLDFVFKKKKAVL